LKEKRLNKRERKEEKRFPHARSLFLGFSPWLTARSIIRYRKALLKQVVSIWYACFYSICVHVSEEKSASQKKV